MLQEVPINDHHDKVMPGECVIERVLEEPDIARSAWRGRLTLHPNVAEHDTIPRT